MKKILIVDDSELIRTQIRHCFKNVFQSIHVATNGKEAVEKMSATQPDVVTMDLTMPKMDGIECITELVKIDPNVRIIVVSALSDNITCLEALKAGAQGFLEKPFTDSDLQNAIEILLED